MNINNLFKYFLEDDFTNDYIADREFQIKTNISLISYWCNMLIEADDGECDYDFRLNVANNIIKHCCQLMQLSELYSNILDSRQDKEINFITIELNEFMKNFIEKCQKHIADKCMITFTESDPIFIEGNEKFFNFILLMCVRKALLENDKKIEISVSSEMNCGIINLKRTRRKVNNDMLFGLDTGVLNANFDDIIHVLINKLNGEISLEKNCIKIKLPLSHGGTFHSKKRLLFEEPLFNIFNIMLSDFDNYKYY